MSYLPLSSSSPPSPSTATATPKSSKNILITGGAQGIGRVIARHFLSQRDAQHRVFLIDVKAAELAYCTDVHLGGGRRAAGAAADLRDPAQVRRAVDAAAAWFGGRIDVLVNNAGVGPFWGGGRTMEDPATAGEWASVLATNLTGPFLVSQAAIPFMKREVGAAGRESAGAGGREEAGKGKEGENTASTADNNTTTTTTTHIENTADTNTAAAAPAPAPAPAEDRFAPGPCVIHIASFRAHRSDPNSEAYAASKAGLVGLTHAMAVSAQRWGIRVNAISPGFISAAHECRAGDERGAAWESAHSEQEHAIFPAGRCGRGEDVAEAVEYIMGAGYLTGQELTIDGGAEKAKHVLDP